jgi:hypothetical protein
MKNTPQHMGSAQVRFDRRKDAGIAQLRALRLRLGRCFCGYSLRSQDCFCASIDWAAQRAWRSGDDSSCTDDVCGSPLVGRRNSLHYPSWCVSVLSPLVARAMISRSLVRDVSRVFCSRRGDDASRRAFQPRCCGRMHAATERRVHVKVTGLAVSYAFDFR